MHRKMQMTNDLQRPTNPPMLLRNQTRGSTPRQGQVSPMKKMMVAAYLVGVLMTPSVRAQADQQTANWLGSMKARIDSKPATIEAFASGVSLDFNMRDDAVVTAADFHRLSDLPRLQKLSLYPFATDAIVAEVAKAAPNLTELGLHESKALTDAGLTVLQDLKNLRRVTAFGTRIGAAGVAHLARIPALDDLDISNTPGGDNTLIALQAATKLRSLTYNRAPIIGEAGWAAIASYPALQSLTINAEAAIGPEIGRLAASKTIERLSLMMAKIDDEGGVKLGDAKTLQSVFVWNTQVGDATMVALGTLAKMRTLYIDRTRATDKGVRGLAGAQMLETFWLSETSISGTGFDAFQNHAKLSWIRASKTPITDDGLKAIGGVKSLRTLSIDGSKVTDSGLAALGGHPNLSSLDLSETSITDEGLAHLLKVPNLTRLTIRRTKITDAGITALRSAMPKLQISK